MINPTQFAVIVMRRHAVSLRSSRTGSGSGIGEPHRDAERCRWHGTPVAARPRKPRRRAGRVYLFRGALGPIFSRGMDSLTEQLEQAGIKADVYEFTICRLIAAQAIRDYRSDPVPITLIGHSMGGLCALTFADILRSENIPVSLVVTIDPAHASPKVPLNVERYINIFLSTAYWAAATWCRSRAIRATTQASTLKDTRKSRTSISTRWIPSTSNWSRDRPARDDTGEGRGRDGAAALCRSSRLARRVVGQRHPADSPVRAIRCSKLAAIHHVPLWSLTQINRIAESAPLTAGQRVIIPRHLLPAVTAPAKWPPLR